MANYPVQLANESAQAYQAACAYFVMGVGRSQEAVSEQLAKSRQLMSRWGAQHDWVNRAHAYDAALALEAAEAHTTRYLADLEAHRRKAMEAGQGLYTVAGRMLQRLNKELDSIELTPATLNVLRGVFQTSLDLEAHALGVDTILGDLTDKEDAR